ncbi:hypothetical protein CU097_011566 [Rhizopus azygosporus]|uniref:Uncharacterized protein n=1 Tax=Rhizopus azygosporus TaxID=86630 RepID=A0A367JSB6_RHIAZ|nr:hypothetical protein CU097_011566 [Rhizopus azygosporus]
MSQFKVHSSLNLNISGFFKEYDISNWTFSNYYDYEKTMRPSFCISDLDKISNLSYLSLEDKSRIGHAKRLRINTNGESSAIINNSGTVVSNSSNATIQNCVVGSSEISKKRKIIFTKEDKG